MIWFEYEYTTSTGIINSIKLISEYTYLDYIIFATFIILLIATIYYIVPAINLYFEYKKDEKQKEKRKELIKQIAFQKNINDEIEKELWI